MKSLIKSVIVVGFRGEVGRALYELAREKYKTYGVDVGTVEEVAQPIDLMHVCIPCRNQDEFIRVVVSYIKRYKPKYVVIDSTVPVGTTERIYNKTGVKIAHSPVRGKHPNIKAGLFQYVKFIGPIDKETGKVVQDYYSSLKVESFVCDSPKETELGKLLSTSYYGLCIAWHQEMARMCAKWKINFDQAVTRFNETYNKGCVAVNPKWARPVLWVDPTGIGGHCVIPNIELLQKQFKSDFLDAIIASNEKQKKHGKK